MTPRNADLMAAHVKEAARAAAQTVGPPRGLGGPPDGRHDPLPNRGVTLTHRGIVAAICAAAEPSVVPACRVANCGEHAGGPTRMCRRHREMQAASP